MKDWLGRHGWRVQEVTLVNGEKRWEVFHWFVSKGKWHDDVTPYMWIRQQQGFAVQKRSRAHEQG